MDRRLRRPSRPAQGRPRSATLQRTQRTEKRIGVGNRPRDVVAAYPSIRCTERRRDYQLTLVGRFLTLRAANGRLTAFVVGTPWYGRDRTQRVIEVMVTATPRPLKGERDWPCPAGWQQE